VGVEKLNDQLTGPGERGEKSFSGGKQKGVINLEAKWFFSPVRIRGKGPLSDYKKQTAKKKE